MGLKKIILYVSWQQAKIMIAITTILLLLNQTLIAQTINRVEWFFPSNDELHVENQIGKYNKYDFSKIWKTTENNRILGIIGNDHRRLKIKLINVVKDNSNKNKYLVNGKSNMDGAIKDFSGTIELKIINELKEFRFGVDDEYADKGIKAQGVLIADYNFIEDSEQNDSGKFKGKLFTKWFLNSDDQIEYDNIEKVADGFINNAFIGFWEKHESDIEIICNWGDYRVPITNRDFDLGAGEFSPNEKYHDEGWSNYHKAWIYNDEKAKKNELKEWWK